MNYINESKTIIATVTTELTQNQALALVQFVNRLTWSVIQACAIGVMGAKLLSMKMKPG
ncbi:DUF7706 family protein [Serratia symbiotica]